MIRHRVLRLLERYGTAYRFGRLQASFDRLLRQWVAASLQPMRLSSTEWLLLGVTRDVPTGLRPRAIAKALGIRPPLVTVLLRRLQRRRLVTVEPDRNDRRSVTIKPTQTGIRLLLRVEHVLSRRSRPLFRATSMKDLVTYLEFVELVVENARTQTRRSGSTKKPRR